METTSVGRVGRVGTVGVLTILVLWTYGGLTRDLPLITHATRTGVLTEIWVGLHGLVLVGTALSVAAQRLPTRPGLVLGWMIALLSVVGISVLRLVPELSPHTPWLAAVMGIGLLTVALGPSALLAGTVGGWLGARFARTHAEPVVLDEDDTPLHLPPALRELLDTTRILHSTLQGGHGCLSTMESTLAFGWAQSLGGLDDTTREDLRWRGVEIEPLVQQVTGSIPELARVQLLDVTDSVLVRLQANHMRPSYR